MTDSMVEVTQADRDAIELVFLHFRSGRPAKALEELARHRIASEQSSQAQIAAMREALEPFSKLVAVQIRLPRDDETGDYVVHLEVRSTEPDDFQPAFKHWDSVRALLEQERPNGQ